jgi:hypothetical protein
VEIRQIYCRIASDLHQSEVILNTICTYSEAKLKQLLTESEVNQAKFLIWFRCQLPVTNYTSLQTSDSRLASDSHQTADTKTSPDMLQI